MNRFYENVGVKIQRECRTHVKDYCEKCGFVALSKCQLDIDHIDGNHDNNDVDNLQTLCANCHRLKTHRKKQFNEITAIRKVS